MKKLLTFAALTIATLLSSCQKPNTIPDPSFDEDGHLVTKPQKTFKIEDPSRVKFYVEVSGSINGFFRRNMATDFKIDLWDIVYFIHLSNSIVKQINFIRGSMEFECFSHDDH